jgi:hypothetical protein
VYSPVPVLETEATPLMSEAETAAEAFKEMLPARRTGFLKNE